MNQGLFLVATVKRDLLEGDLDWLCADDDPYVEVDPIDFLQDAAVAAVYGLYVRQYGQIDEKLNIPMPEGLLEFNRWIIIHDDDDAIIAFACFKTNEAGLKLGLAATDGDIDGKSALKVLLRRGLLVDGVYAEVSGGAELAVTGHVPEVPPSAVSRILDKPVTIEDDNRHYTREIANVGTKRKLLVGKPLV